MKKIISMACLFMSFNAFCEFPVTDIREFKGSYQRPEGNGSADSLIFPEIGKPATEAIKIKVIEKDKGYLLTYGAEEFLYENPPEFLADVDSFHVNGLNILTKENTASLDIYAIDTAGREGKARVRDLKANCLENDSSITDFSTKLIDSCLTNSHVNFSEIYVEQVSDSAGAVKGLSDVMNLFATEEDLTSSDKIDLQNFKLNVNNHRFSLSSKINIGLKATIKASGVTEYEKDKNRIKIKISSVKAGIFNITSKVFKTLKESESETFIVQKPYVYILMK
jgi:hypothetical protein